MAKKTKTTDVTAKQLPEDFKITSFKQYRDYAQRTLPDLGTQDDNTTHMLIGVITEIGELSNLFKRELAYKKPLDLVGVSEEWADQMWYIACESLHKEFTFAVDDGIISYFKRTNYKKPLHKLVSIESTKVFAKALDSPIYMSLYFNWLVFLAEKLEIDMFDALTKNILKLAERFGDKFSEFAALNRNVQKEREILEGKSGLEVGVGADKEQEQ